jgi:hypothetical protein
MFLYCLERFLNKIEPVDDGFIPHGTSIVVPTEDGRLHVVLFDHMSDLAAHASYYPLKSCRKDSVTTLTATNGRTRFTLPQRNTLFTDPAFVARPFTGIDPNPIDPSIVNDLHHRFCPDYQLFVEALSLPEAGSYHESAHRLNQCIRSLKEPYTFLDKATHDQMVDGELVRFRTTFIFNSYFNDAKRMGANEVLINDVEQRIIYGALSIIIANILSGNFKIAGELPWEESRDMFMNFIKANKPIGIEVDDLVLKIGFTDTTSARISASPGEFMEFSVKQPPVVPEEPTVGEEEE